MLSIGDKNLKKLLSPSLFPTLRRQKYSGATSCNTGGIYKNYMVFIIIFVFTITGKKYYVRGDLTCNSANVNYLVECINCKCQYVGYATSFKRFCIYKSDIKAKKDRCGTARHCNSI